jgi:transcriptional regulator with XRE-family HTH domain
MKLSELIKSKRETKNLLLREVASMIDVDTALIRKIEKGDRKPTREQIEKLAVALDIEHNKLSKLLLNAKKNRVENQNRLLIEVGFGFN